MPTVAYRVRSTRIKDIELSANKTIKDLKNILAANGYDVNEATRVRVIRRDAIVIGQMDNYVLRDGDCIEIDTQIIGPFDALEARGERVKREAAREAAIEAATNKTCNKRGKHIEIARIGNLGIAIRVVED